MNITLGQAVLSAGSASPQFNLPFTTQSYIYYIENNTGLTFRLSHGLTFYLLSGEFIEKYKAQN